MPNSYNHPPIRKAVASGGQDCIIPPPIQSQKRDKNYKPNSIYGFNFLYYNCRGLASEERIYELEKATENIKWDVLGLAEVRRTGEQLIKRTNGNLLYYYGTTKGYRGVGFYINRSITDRIVEVKGITERVAVLKLKINTSTYITIIQVYAPISTADESEIKEFYKLIEEVYNKEKEYFTFIMGDWNAKIGNQSIDGWNVGKFCYGATNDSGQKLIELMRANGLKLANSFFPKKESRMWTWESPDGKTRNTIDHILVNDRSIVKNVQTLPSFKFASDHRLCRCKIRFQRRIKVMNYRKKKEKAEVIVPIHKTQELKDTLKQKLQEYKFTNQKNVQKKYDILEKSIKESVCLVGEKKLRPTTDDKLTTETKKLIDKRAKLRQIKTKSKKVKIELTELNKLIKKEIRKDIKNYEDELTKEIIEESWSTKKVKKALSKGRNWMIGINTDEGKSIYNREKILEVTTKFFSKLYKVGKDDETQERKKEQDISREDEIPEILTSETKQMLKQINKNKVAGPDRIENDILKRCAEVLAQPLTDLFNLIVKTGEVPSQWRLAEIILIHKKGDRKNLNNFRPISLASNLSKIFLKIVKERIFEKLDFNQANEQAGFRKKRSTVDQLFVINQLLERAREYSIKLNLLFIDYNKAFDSVFHNKVWEALGNQGIESKWTNVIKNLYEGAQARISQEQKGRWFSIERGVRQGDPLSPNLFNAVLEEIFRKLEWKDKGIMVNGKRLNHLRFADDIVLITDDLREMEEMANELRTESSRVGLEMNLGKTKLLTSQKEAEFKINDNKIECVDEYKYLGQIVSLELRQEKEISARIKNTWKNFWSQKEILQSKISLKNKIKIIESVIYPTLTYGSQTWSLTKKQLSKMQVTQRKMLRKILRKKLSDKVKNQEILESTNSKDIAYRIKKLKLDYAGHIFRSDPANLTKSVMDWLPLDRKRKRGRPPTRWRDEISKSMGILWGRIAVNRKAWKKVVDAYAQRWAG